MSSNTGEGDALEKVTEIATRKTEGKLCLVKSK